MKTKLFVVFCALASLFVSCKEQEELTQFKCDWDIQPEPIFTEDAVVQPASDNITPGSMNKTGMDQVRQVTHQFIPTGGDGISDSQQGYSYKLSDWGPVLDTSEGGPVCGGIANIMYHVVETVDSSVASAVIVIDHKTMANGSRGHAVNLFAVWQDDSLVFTIQDAMFNYTAVLKSDTTKLADIRDIKRWGKEGTLTQYAKLTRNTTPSFYFQEESCAWDENVYYDSDEVVGVYNSGRIKYPYFIYAPRTIERYAQRFVMNEETFNVAYNDIGSSYGHAWVDYTNPDNLIWIYASTLGFIRHDNNPVWNKIDFGQMNQ